MTRHAMRARREAARRPDASPNAVPNAVPSAVPSAVPNAPAAAPAGAPREPGPPRLLGAAPGGPAVTDPATLAAALERTADALSRLTDDPRYSPEEQQRFALQADDLRRQISALDGAAFSAGTAQYAAAAAALGDVNRTLAGAAGRIADVTAFVELVARVAGVVGTIISTAV